jgi:phage repressor protein C with HTH and peptisase S24 domain
MSDMNTIATRLKYLRDRKGWTQTQLAVVADVSQGTVGNIEAGKRAGKGSLIKLARVLDASLDWLIDGEGPMLISEWIEVQARLVDEPDQVLIRNQTNVETADSLKPKKGVPVVGEVKGGSDGYIDELQYPEGHGDGFVDYPTTDANAYALRVRGDSMHPRYRAGEYIVIEPSIEPQTGDDVVVSTTDGRKLLKELNWQRDGEIQLLSVNNHYGPLTLQSCDVMSIHLVAGRARRSAFVKEVKS